MPRIRLLIAAAWLGAAPLAMGQPGQPAAKKVYCWNEGGRKVCGDALPSSAVDAARTEINTRSGMATARIDRAPTADERAAAEARARTEAASAAAEEAEARRFMAMVQSFDTEDELRKAFGNRIALNRDSIKTARMGIAGVRTMLVDLLKRAGQAELARRPVPAKLAADIRGQHAELLRQQAVLARLQRDELQIRAQLDEAVTRYRAARAPRTGAVAGAIVPAG